MSGIYLSSVVWLNYNLLLPANEFVIDLGKERLSVPWPVPTFLQWKRLPGISMKRNLLVLLVCFFSIGLQAAPFLERRMAIEIGASAITYAVADVDPTSDRIVKIHDSDIVSGSFP